MRTYRYLVLLAITALLAACHASWVTDLTARSGDEIYHDDFSDSSSGWPQTSGPNGAIGYDGGTFRIRVLTPNYDLWAFPGQEFGNVQLEANATRLAGPDSNRFGLICRYRDSQNFYFFIISSDGYFAIGKVSGGVRTLIGQEMMAYSPEIVRGNGPNHLRFDCFNKTLTAFVNGKIVAITTDADLTSGDAGLLAGAFDQPGVDVSFDDFVVIKP
jgi:hypothetical protein